ncbi:TPA: competence protein CoiA family protein, partial [Legionella pneumophila]
KLPFAIDANNILLHISDVISGKNCNCFCPSCHSPLIAAKGNKIQHHFKHADLNECNNGLESAIHLAAKKIILERKKLTLPEYVITASATDSWGYQYSNLETVVPDGTVILFDSVQAEKEIHGMRADLLAIKNNSRLIIEILYCHKVDDQKIMKIREAKISALEINLSDLTPQDVKDWETFWLCINNTSRLKWLYNVRAESCIYPKLITQLSGKIHEQENKYKRKEIPMLERALQDLKILRSKERIALYSIEAQTSNAWEVYGKTLNFSFDELPNFLNLDVPNGDWIFGCDRRIWQTVFYTYFVKMINAQSFSIRWVEDVLISICKPPSSPKIVEIYGKRYPEVIPKDFYNAIPSPIETLSDYFNQLCKLGMLEFYRNDLDLSEQVYKILR